MRRQRRTIDEWKNTLAEQQGKRSLKTVHVLPLLVRFF